MRIALLTFLFLSAAPVLLRAERVGDIEFRADYYTRDLQTNTIQGRGHAWMRKGGREISADEIEVDLTAKRATANGNVHFSEGDIHIWCRHLNHALESSDATMEDVTLVAGQLVLTGSVIQRLSEKTYRIEEGTYSNCNVTLSKDPSIGKCALDWKLYGKRFDITLESYAHVQDALIYVKDMPVFYSPYFVAPIKTNRTSGFLFPQFSFAENLGNSITLPYYLVLGPWHDATFTPVWYSKVGYRLGVNYRYKYSEDTFGDASLYFLQRRFSADRNFPGTEDHQRDRAFGLIGEFAVDARNQVKLGGRSHSMQVLRWVTDPYYTFDYAGDFRDGANMPSLRSLVSYTHPSDKTLFTGKVEHHQSLLISEDTGVDQGSVLQLPQFTYSLTNTSLWGNWLRYEVDSSFNNFFRFGQSYDPVPLSLNTSLPIPANHVDPNPEYHDGDYIRAGQRFHLEPRLFVNVPLASGFQLQPNLRAGTVFYHFGVPNDQVIHREYLQVETPFSLYFTKRFQTSIDGFESLNHVFQPRVVYASTLYQSDIDHPFFYKDTARGLSNPRFDFTDQLVPFQYLRFELNNRLYRKVGQSSERFFLLQLSEQYNLRTSSDDPRFLRRTGPIEILSEFKLWRFTGQLQANYQLETAQRGGEEVRENEFSSTLEYTAPNTDRVLVGNRTRINVDDNLTEKTALLQFYKTTPLFFDLEGGMEYSYKRGDLLGARLGFLFGSKPYSCWGINFTFGQNDLKQRFVRLLFRLDFGSATVPNKS